MATETNIYIYRGPLEWFTTESANDGARKPKMLLDQARLYAEHHRKQRMFLSTPDGDPDMASRMPRPKRAKHVVAEAGSYSSLTGFAMQDFADVVREFRPKNLYLHNPPESVRTQLERTFPTTTTIRTYDYPAFNLEVLKDVRDKYDDTIVGQTDVRDRLLASLLPLTRDTHDKPVVIMLYGPSGVGKTETAKFINGLLGTGDLMRKQFSMFHSNKFASYLFGGEHNEASLAKDLLDRTSSVILFDEFDKAAEVFHSAFYQLFEEGVFEDTTYRVDVGRALIICTSNYTSENDVRAAVGEALSSRFTAMIEFSQLTPHDVLIVVDRLVTARLDRLSDDKRAAIDAADLHRVLVSEIATHHGNVRQLAATIDEAVNIRLVDALLGPQEAPAAHDPAEDTGEPPDQDLDLTVTA
ncbi:MAG: ATP-dependent Clp protease ATP-binding subunit [Actinomycetales bacterium]|nr:MAG: ATP-dependent Clp protease ATP-binding subunit [Actinomycetales bacterium]